MWDPSLSFGMTAYFRFQQRKQNHVADIASSQTPCYQTNMAQDLDQLTKEAFMLPPEERVVLAESLLLTIDEAHDQMLDATVMAELERRLRDVQEGKVKGIPAQEAVRRVRETLKNRA